MAKNEHNSAKELGWIFSDLIDEFAQSLLSDSRYSCEIPKDDDDYYNLIEQGATYLYFDDGLRLITTYIARAQRFIEAKYPEAVQTIDYDLLDPIIRG